MAFQGEVVAQAVAQTARRNTRTVTEIADAVIAAQGTGRHGKVAQALLQQTAGDVKRHGGRDLPTEGIGGDHHGFAGAVDERNIGQRVGAGLQVGAAGFVAVDEQVDRGWHCRFPGKLRQRISHQVRAHTEIPRQLNPAQAHRTAPGQCAADQVTGLVGQQSLVIGVAPGGVVTQVAIVQRTDRIAGQRAPVLPGVGQRAPAVEQSHFVPGRQVSAGIIGVVEVQVVVEQGTETAQGRSARVGVAIADELLRQPAGRYVEQQALTGAVVLAVQARQAVEVDFGAEGVRQFHTGVTQRVGRQEKPPVALLHRHDVSGIHLIDHQFQKQLRISHGLHAAGWRRQITGLGRVSERQATHTAHGADQRTLETAGPMRAHYRFTSVDGPCLPFPSVADQRAGVMLCTCGEPFTRTCNAGSCAIGPGAGQRMIAPGST
ncbi:hypothetical protein D3C84_525470 [compost metagenome]